MSKEGKITTVHPTWLDTTVPPEYEDKGMYEIILFFVIHSPCSGQSENGISLSERGWKEKPWNSSKYLKEKLDNVIFDTNTRMLKMADSKHEMLSEIERYNLDDDFYNYREHQRALYVKVSKAGCENEYMSLFYHIRNALAHGRIAMYPTKMVILLFVMEDGKQKGKDDDRFEVSARIVINKSSLLKVIELLKNPPIENDYSDDIVIAIKSGYCTKRKIMTELCIDDYTYKKYIKSLKIQQKITFKESKWHLV